MNPEQVVASKEEFDEVVDKVMSSGKYWRFNNEVIKGMGSLLEKFRKWIEDFLDSRLEGIEDVEGISSVLSVVIAVIIGIVILAAIILIIRYVYHSFYGKKKLKEILGEKITKDTTPFSLKEKADNYERQWQYRMSVRYSYIGLLLLMHEKNILYIENTMTNKEIYECLQKEEYALIDVFKGLMEIFNETWYGQHEMTKEGYGHYKDQFIRIWNEVTAYEKARKQK